MSIFRKKREREEEYSGMRAGDLSLGRTGVALKDTYMMRVPWGMRVEAGGRRWMVNGTAFLKISSPEMVKKLYSVDTDKLSGGKEVMDYFVEDGVAHGFLLPLCKKIRESLRSSIEEYISREEISAEGLEKCLNSDEVIGQLSAALKGFKLDGAPHILKVGTLERVPDAD